MLKEYTGNLKPSIDPFRKGETPIFLKRVSNLIMKVSK